MSTPFEAFQFIDRVLAGQRLSLTIPEFSQFAQAMNILAEALRKDQQNEILIRPSTP